MNYTKTFNVSNGGNITLCGSKCAADINITNSGYTTHIVIDVQGYYVKPMWAYVNADGTLGANSRAVSVRHLSDHEAPYVVTFDRDLSNCGFTVTGDYQAWSANTEGTSASDSHGVYVEIYGGNPRGWIDAPFYVTVTC